MADVLLRVVAIAIAGLVVAGFCCLLFDASEG